MSIQFALNERASNSALLALLRSRLLWAALATIVIATRYLFSNGEMLLAGSGGTDDMTRLLQVRELAASGNWFDRTIPAIGAPEALRSHWSRLIDLPLLMLTGALGTVFSVATSELVTRVLWPSALLFALLFAVMREAERQSGLVAAIAVIVLAVNGASAIFQFNPGRIDHHNVQILCAVIGILYLQRSFADPKIGWWAGAFLGLGLTVGLESLFLIGAVIGLAALFSCFANEMRDGIVRALIASLIPVWAALLLTIAPAHWLQPACDELSLNLALMLTVGTAAYAVLYRKFAGAPATVWLGGLAAGGGLALGAYLAVEPACAGGPFAMVDPAVKPVWLDHVIEVKSLFDFAMVTPSGAISFVACALLGCAAAGWAYQRQRDAGSLFALCVLVMATIYSCIYVKLMPYAMWLAIPALALAIARLPAIGEIPERTVRFGAIVIAGQATIQVLVASLVALVSDIEATAKTKLTASTNSCQSRAYVRALDALPAGLVANELDLGPFIGLYAKHRVVSAPYHRIDKSILATFEFLKGTPAVAERVLRRLGANYVVVCRRDAKALAEIPRDTMMFALQSGAAIDFLERVELGDAKLPLMVWRVRSLPP